MITIETTREKIHNLVRDDLTTLSSQLPDILLRGEPYLELMGEMVQLADLAKCYAKPSPVTEIPEPKDTGPVQKPKFYPGLRGTMVSEDEIGVEGEMTTWLLSENGRAYRRASIHHPNGLEDKVLCLLYRNGDLTYDGITELLDGPFRDRWASDYYRVGTLAALQKAEFVTIAGGGHKAGVQGKASRVLSLTSLGRLNVSKGDK